MSRYIYIYIYDATIKELLEEVFTCGPCLRVIIMTSIEFS
jgi:hypothetical protein